MAAEAQAALVLAAALTGLLVSVLLEALLRPRPPLRRPAGAWAVHAGLVLLAHGVLTLLLGRPWFAMAVVLALLLTVVLVNNAKFKALREPFVLQDYEYFIDTLRYPRLYIPFFGWLRFALATAGFVAAVGVGWWLEPAPQHRWSLSGQGGALALELLGAAALLAAGGRAPRAPGFEAQRDLLALGLLGCLWHQGRQARQAPAAASPFAAKPAGAAPAPEGQPTGRAPSSAATTNPRHAAAGSALARLPHLVAVQSESFFDPRTLFAGIRPDVLQAFDGLQRAAWAHGELQVPAWGANTVRTEFAFLTGVDPRRLGVHGFNPYRAIAGGWSVGSLAQHLRRLGYRTVCVHPYPAGFYLRHKVYPLLGFDAFIDIREFDAAARFGPYVSDAAVADRIDALLRAQQHASQPLFVFAITMENHGPLHLERVAEGDVARLYRTAPPEGCEALTIYLRHLDNADRMLASLHERLQALERPASLCWYGDHVPILSAAYAHFGAPDGRVPYACWADARLAVAPAAAAPAGLAAHALSRQWLAGLGLWPAAAAV